MGCFVFFRSRFSCVGKREGGGGEGGPGKGVANFAGDASSKREETAEEEKEEGRGKERRSRAARNETNAVAM